MAFPRRDSAEFDGLEALLDQVTADYFEAIDAGSAPCLDDLLRFYPDLEAELRALLEAHGGVGRALRAAVSPEAADGPERAGAFGDYELLEIIGRGGMGVVYRARHRRNGCEVALKTLLSTRLLDPESRRRFERECLAVARLEHPNIVRVLEVGAADGIPFFAMERIDGGDLASRGREFLQDPRAAAHLVAQVARGVEHAHRRGVVHRDLKPANVLLDSAGRPYVTDFGLASAESAQSLTASGAVLGTPAYMAPEAARGGAACSGTPSDVFSLGVMLFELVTGRLPFDGTTAAELLRAIEEEPPPLPSRIAPAVPRDLETIVMHALEKDPARRYLDAGALANDLERFLAGEAIAARRPGIAQRSLRWCWTHPVAALIWAVLCVACLASGLASIAFERQRDAARLAEGRATARLRDSLLAQARLLTRSGEAGQRHGALEAIGAAARLGGEPAWRDALRDEAIAALALPDVRVVRTPEGGSEPDCAWAAVDPAASRIARFLRGERGENRVRLDRFAADGALPRDDARWLDAPSGERIAVREMRFCPQGVRLGTVVEQRNELRLSVWDLDREPPVLRGAATLPATRAWDFRPDDAAVVTVASEGLLIHDRAASAGGEPWALPGAASGGRATVLRFDASGERLAIARASADGARLEVRRWPSGELLREFPAAAPVSDLAWAQSGERLAAASGKGIDIWNIGTAVREATLLGHRSVVTAVAFSPRDDLLASTSWDGTLRFWDAARGRALLQASAGNFAVGFLAGGAQVAVASRTGAHSIFNLDRSPILRELDDGRPGVDAIASAAFSPDSRWLVVAGHGGLRLWELESGRSTAFVPSQGKLYAAEFSPAFSGEGTFILAWGTHGLWSFEWTGAGVVGAGRWIGLFGATRDARDAAFAAGRCVLLGDYRRGRAVAAFAASEDPPSRATVALRQFGGFQYVALSPSGRLVAAGERFVAQRLVRFWDAATGEPSGDLDVGGPARCAFSPDGALLLTGTGAEQVLWDVENRTVVWRVARRSPSGLPGPGAFSPDGARVAVASSDHEVHVLDVRSGSKRYALNPPRASIVKRLAFSPDGRQLAATTEDNLVLCWNLEEVERELRAMGLAADD